MKDIIPMVIIFFILAIPFIISAKAKNRGDAALGSSREDTGPRVHNRKHGLFGSITFFMAILMFLWGVFGLVGGPDANPKSTTVPGIVLILLSLILGYKSVK